jgi:branched-chain amino acid aminotransferase
MIVFLNGQFVPEEEAVVSVFDRGFLYGDGLFETMRIFRGRPFRWAAHMERLERGAEFLRIAPPIHAEALRAAADELVARNQMQEALLRLTLSRGVGPRGYSPAGAVHPTLAMSLHPAPLTDRRNPPRWRLVTASFRLPANEPIAQFKTCNKLPQILARAQADVAGADEALLLNTDGFVVEASSSNLFWIDDEGVATAPLPSGVLAGVTRGVVWEICGGLGLAVREACVTPEQLRLPRGVFLSLSSVGVAEAVSLDGHDLSLSPNVDRIRDGYDTLTSAESL